MHISYKGRNNILDDEKLVKLVNNIVSAINAKELQVTFNKAVDAKTIFVDATAETKVLKNNIFFTETTALNGNKANLSADGKTLTITASTNWEGTYIFKVAKETVKTTGNKYVGEYSEKFSFEDTTAPTIVSEEKVNAGKVKVKFSEPIKSLGNVTAKLADGTVVSPTVAFTAGNDYAEITLTTDAGKSVTYSFAGALDYSDNLISPNPATITVAKGAKDGVAPEITSVKAVNSKKFEVKLSEEAIGFAAGDVTVSGATVKSLDVDKTDKTKYILEVNENLNGKLVTVAVAADTFTDLSGENNKAFSKVIEVNEDSVKPTLASSAVTKDVNGNEVLTLTFSEDVTFTGAGTVSLDAVKVKDYVTTPGTSITFAANKLTLVENTKNQYKIALSDLQEGSSPLVKGATYTVDLAAGLFVDNAGLSNEKKTSAFSFTRDADTNSEKPALVKGFDSTQGTVGGTLKASFVDANGILVTGNNTFKVKFDKALDGVSATNKSNYQVSGATVDKVTLLADNEVEVTLVKDSNTFSGLRTVTVSGVKSSTGVALTDYSASEYFNENVRETVSSATVGSIVADSDAGTPGDQPLTTVTLTFSDALATTGSTVDFDLYVKGVKDAAAVTATAVDGNKVTVTIAKALTATDFNNGVELKAASTIDIADAVGNVVNVANPVKLTLN
jgi:hypothetical protein